MLRAPNPATADLIARARAAAKPARRRESVRRLREHAQATASRRAPTVEAPRSPYPPHDDEPHDIRLRGRLTIVAGALIVACVVLLGRVYALQINEHERYADAWNAQSLRVESIPSLRGGITDRTGRAAFAITRLSGKSLYAVPSLMTDEHRGALAIALGEALDIEPNALYIRFRRNATRPFVWIRQRLSDPEHLAVEDLVAHNESLGLRDESIRSYPRGRTLAQIVGFTRRSDGDGLEGIEALYNDILAGEPGMQTLSRDARGRHLRDPDSAYRAPIHGATVALTIDFTVQAIVEEALNTVCERWNPVGAWAIVLDPHTGEVIAMASRPTFDPSDPNAPITNPDGTPYKGWDGEPVVPAAARRNRAITDVYEPGSVFKPGVMLAALEARAVHPGMSIHCEYAEFLIRCTDHQGRHRRTLHDYGNGNGLLPLADVLVKSSNIGMSKVGRLLGFPNLMAYLKSAGFGVSTGLGLVGEVNGKMPVEEQCPQVYSTPSITMGHGIAVTAMQMVMLFGAIANGGELMQPHIVKRITMPDGSVLHEAEPKVRRTLFTDPDALQFVHDAMARVCTPEGTARRADLSKYGIRLAGKTGTADLYGSTGVITSFVGFGPIEDPKYVVLVSVDRPRTNYRENGGGPQPFFGGTVAAPAAAEIFLKALTRAADTDDD